jgi:hypothetical protein
MALRLQDVLRGTKRGFAVALVNRGPKEDDVRDVKALA